MRVRVIFGRSLLMITFGLPLMGGNCGELKKCSDMSWSECYLNGSLCKWDRTYQEPADARCDGTPEPPRKECPEIKVRYNHPYDADDRKKCESVEGCKIEQILAFPRSFYFSCTGTPSQIRQTECPAVRPKYEMYYQDYDDKQKCEKVSGCIYVRQIFGMQNLLREECVDKN
jgi:hypothetical protein